MRSAQLLRKVAQLEAELKQLFDDLPLPVYPVYRAMTDEELFRFIDLMHETINQGNCGGLQDIPEALAIWKTALARIEASFEGQAILALLASAWVRRRLMN